MQNMNYYYDFSGQKFNHPLSLSINSFDRKVFSRQTSLELSYVLKGSYEVITEHISHSHRAGTGCDCTGRDPYTEKTAA